MRFIKSTILVFISGILFLLALFLVLAGLMALDQQFTSLVIHTVTRINMPLAYIVVGLFVFLASLIVYSLAGRAPSSSATFTFEGEKGPIDISLRALEDYIAKYFAEKPVVNSVRTKVGTSRDRQKLRVRASISVWSEQNLKDAGDRVQREIALCLKEGLGLDNVEIIPVSVDRIIASKSPKPVSAKAPADELP